jgi:PAS domain S-box-containing protein
MKFLSNFKIAGKLYAMVVMAIIGIFAIAMIGILQLENVYEGANYATINTIPSFNKLNEARVNLQRARVLALYNVLATDDARVVVLEHQLVETRSKIRQALSYYEAKLISDDEDARILKEIFAAISEYEMGVDVALRQAHKSGNDNMAARDGLEKLAPQVLKVQEAFDKSLTYNEKLATTSSAQALALKTRATEVMIGLGLLIAAMVAVLGRWIARRELSDPIGAVADCLQQLAAGTLDVTISGTRRVDEIGNIARAAQVFKEFVQKLDTQGWIKTHQTEITASLQQAQDFHSLAQIAVSKITPAIGASHGAFYVFDGDRRFNMLGSYGYRERKELSNSYAIGESLVGQCAMEKKPITLRAPKDYIKISSGLGDGPPASIMVQPVVHGDRVLGVIEMASFQQFADRETALVDSLLPVLATNMEIMDRNLRTKELLASTQEQAERMEKQAAQLEEQSVEMEAQQAELLETENWFRSIIEAAPDGMLVADDAGRILLANPALESIFGYSPGELLSLQIEQLVPQRALKGHDKLRDGFMNEGTARAMGAGPHLTARRKDGSEVPVAITLSPLPARGNRGRCVSVTVRLT